MTVRELIQALSKFPPEAHVYLNEDVDTNCMTEDYVPESLQIDEFMLRTYNWNNRFVRHKPIVGEQVVIL